MSSHPYPAAATSTTYRERPVKRRKACAACRARRSKCDLIDYLGCHRCKQLGTDCSLKEADGNDTGLSAVHDRHHPGVAVNQRESAQSGQEVLGIVDRLASLEEEIKRLRGRLSGFKQSAVDSAGHIVSPHADLTPSTNDPTAGLLELRSTPVARQSSVGGEERDETWYRRWADPEAFGLVHRGMKSKGELGLRDPIAEGIILESQAESAYQLFKFHFTNVFPHPPLLQIRSSFPAQAFHLSSCLYYISHCPVTIPLFSSEQVAHLKAYLTQNLQAYHRGCRPSLEGIMAAFVLSFLPPASYVDGADLDSARMIGLAYAQLRELGQSVYMDRLLALLEGGIPISHLEQQLNDARMFMGVINRSAWFAHSRCPWASLPVLVEGAQPKILAFLRENQLACDLDHHLIFEQECLGILFRHSQTWQDLQRILSPSVAEVISGNRIARDCERDLQPLLLRIKSPGSLRSKDYLACHVAYCQWWVSVRNVWSMYRLPTPLLANGIYEGWVEAMAIAAEASVKMLSACLTEVWKLGHWPAAIGRAIVLCFTALSTGIIYFQTIEPTGSLPDILDIGTLLESIENMIRRSDTGLAGMMAVASERLGDYRVQLENARTQETAFYDTQVGPGDLGLNGANPGDATIDMADFFGWWNGEAGNAEMGDAFGGLDNWWGFPMGNNGRDGSG